MIGSTLILCLAMTCQLPGGDCPVPQATPAGAVKRWLDVVNPASGQPMRIWGWMGTEPHVAHFDPQEYPGLARDVASSRVPAPAGGNAYPPTGVVMAKIPAISAGQTWHGGNITGEARSGDKPGRPPDAYLTIIGAKEDRRRVAAKLETDPRFRQARDEMGDRLAIHSYPADARMVTNVGLPDNGRPDVVIQDAEGGEVRRWHSDPDPAEAAQTVRTLDPEYRPGGAAPPAAEGLWTKAGVVLVGVFGSILCCHAMSRRGRWNTRS